MFFHAQKHAQADAFTHRGITQQLLRTEVSDKSSAQEKYDFTRILDNRRIFRSI
jgi:hypothetical protein